VEVRRIGDLAIARSRRMKGDSIESHGDPVVTRRDRAKAMSLHVGAEMEEQVSCPFRSGEVGMEPLIGCVDESSAEGQFFDEF
jgi:hypothetical protein